MNWKLLIQKNYSQLAAVFVVSLFMVAGCIVSARILLHRDIYRIALIIALMGFFLMIIPCYILLRLSSARIGSEEENKSSFLTWVNHEIRTPMNVVIGMSELALGAETLPRMAEYVAEIRKAGLKILALINDMPDLAKIRAGGSANADNGAAHGQ
jgi:signal transduction histidine kinase